MIVLLNKTGSLFFTGFHKIVVDNREGLQINRCCQFTGGAYKKAERSGKLQPLEPDTVSAVVGKVYEAFLSFSFFFAFHSLPYSSSCLPQVSVPVFGLFYFLLILMDS